MELLNADQPAPLTYRALKDATIANRLAFQEVDGHLVRRRVRPIDAVAWADGKRMNVPDALRPYGAQTDSRIDPSDLPDELDCAMIAFQAVRNGYGDQSATFKNRLLAWLDQNRNDLASEARDRIATVANPDKRPGRRST